MLCQQFNQASVVRQHVDRPGLDLCQNALMEVVDPIGHAKRLANTLTAHKVRNIHADKRFGLAGEDSGRFRRRPRLRGRGLPGTPPGDQIVEVEITAPRATSEEQREAYRELGKAFGDDS